MDRRARQELFEDMAAYGIKRFRDGGVEVEALPSQPLKKPAELDGEPVGMPTREEMNELRRKIDERPHVGPAKGV